MHFESNERTKGYIERNTFFVSLEDRKVNRSVWRIGRKFVDRRGVSIIVDDTLAGSKDT